MTAPGNAESKAATTPATGAPLIPQPTSGSTPAKATPAAPAPKASPPPARSGGAAAGAYMLAVFALIIAVASAAGAAYAIKLGRDNQHNEANPQTTTTGSAPQTTQPQAAPTTTASASASASPAASASTSPPVTYTPELVRAQVPVAVPTGCNSTYVDVDTLAVGVQAGHEFYLSKCQDPQTLQIRVDQTSGRSTSGPNPTPETCGSLVAGTPTTELVLEAKTGLTFCLLTNKAQAAAQNLPQRLAIVEVLDVSATEVQLAVSTYRLS